jgi:hypothetical protein
MQHFIHLIRARVANCRALAVEFWVSEQAQDITEYTLLLSFVVLASMAVLVLNGSSMTVIWGDAKGILAQAHVQAAGS